MKQYIDKSDVVAEIEKLISNGETELQEAEECKDSESYVALAERIATCINVLSFLDTLEVKKVDLEEELDYNDYMTFFKEHPDYNNGSWGFEETWTFGQYCYKLGLKAQKGE